MNTLNLKSILLLLTICCHSDNGKQVSCNKKILGYYGITDNQIPQPFAPISALLTENNCLNMQNTCCSLTDFSQINESWTTASTEISNALLQLFLVYQNANEIQSSIVKLLPKLLNKDFAACQKIDLTFLRNQLPFDQVGLIVKTAIETMAYLFKGFYCMICDADNQKWFAYGQDLNRYLVMLKANTCSDLMRHFRDFLSYKFYYFDPMIINMNTMLNCANGNEELVFDNSYRMDYNTINDCLLHGDNCEDVCAEFRFGVSSNLFIGNLDNYKLTLDKFQVLVNQLSGADVSFLNIELENKTVQEFFVINKTNTDNFSGGNLTRYDLVFLDDGIDLFKAAQNGDFYYGKRPVVQNISVGVQDNGDQESVADSVNIQDSVATNDVSIAANQIVSLSAVPATSTYSGAQSSNSTPQVQSQSPKKPLVVAVTPTVGSQLNAMSANNATPNPTEVSSLSGTMNSDEQQFIQSLNQQAAG